MNRSAGGIATRCTTPKGFCAAQLIAAVAAGRTSMAAIAKAAAEIIKFRTTRGRIEEQRFRNGRTRSIRKRATNTVAVTVSVRIAGRISRKTM